MGSLGVGELPGWGMLGYPEAQAFMCRCVYRGWVGVGVRQGDSLSRSQVSVLSELIP